MQDKMTWQEFAEANNFDFEQAVRLRKMGRSWNAINTTTATTYSLKRIVEDYCKDQGINFGVIAGYTGGPTILHNVADVDQGKVWALHNAGWKDYDIALDCHCLLECVKEILNGNRETLPDMR